MDKIEKIMAEIERYEKTAIEAYNPRGEDADFWHGKVVACEDIKAFINTLSDEPKKGYDEKYQQGIHDGKEEALMDLPRWEKYPHNAGEEPLVNGILQEDGSYKWRLYLNGYKIEISDLEKLPGFKED